MLTTRISTTLAGRACENVFGEFNITSVGSVPDTDHQSWHVPSPGNLIYILSADGLSGRGLQYPPPEFARPFPGEPAMIDNSPSVLHLEGELLIQRLPPELASTSRRLPVDP